MKISGTTLLFLIGILALSLRLSPLARSDFKFQTGWDAADYLPLAHGLQHGCGFARFEDGRCGAPYLSRPPGYPLFVAIMPGLTTVLIFQAVFGASLCIWIGFFVVSRWGAAAGLIAATLLAIDIPSIVYGGMIMSEALFQFLLTGAILLQASAIISGCLNFSTATKVFGAAIMFALAAMIRPTGLLLPLFVPVPFLLIRCPAWPRGLICALLAVSIPLSAMIAWVFRNASVRGTDVLSTDSAITIFDYNAAGILAFAKNISFDQARAELTREIRWQGEPSSPLPDSFSSAMIHKGLQVFFQHPFAAAIVGLRGFLLVATVPDRNELNVLIGTNGGGPYRLPPSFKTLARIRNTLHSPLLTSLVALQLVLNLFIWTGVARSLFRTDWNSGINRALVLLMLSAALTMLSFAASPAAHARFRVPAIPFLAILAGIGWSSATRKARRSESSHTAATQTLYAEASSYS